MINLFAGQYMRVATPGGREDVLLGKPSIGYGHLIFFFFLLGFSGFLVAQDPYLQEGEKELEKVATDLMRRYQQELGMTVEQAILFRDKVEEFEIRRDEVKTRNLPVKEALRLLGAISRQETAEMANILTRPQLRVYRKLKSSLQPVELVVGQVEPPD